MHTASVVATGSSNKPVSKQTSLGVTHYPHHHHHHPQQQGRNKNKLPNQSPSESTTETPADAAAGYKTPSFLFASVIASSGDGDESKAPTIMLKTLSTTGKQMTLSSSSICSNSNFIAAHASSPNLVIVQSAGSVSIGNSAAASEQSVW